MAYGTESIPKSIKYLDREISMLQKPKRLVQQDGIAIDMPAGPSEVLVIADAKADPGLLQPTCFRRLNMELTARLLC